jgi:hypothetical protein
MSAKTAAFMTEEDHARLRPDAPCSMDRPVRLRVTCMNLRHKLMYVDPRHAQRGMVDVNSDTRIYWCAMTQEQLGPDQQPVGPGDCSNGRGCYCHGE